MVDKTRIQQEMVDKWSIKPTLAGKLADIIEFMADKEEIKTESNVIQKVSIRFFNDREVRAVWDETLSEWWFPFWMLLVCSTTKTIIPRTETIGSI